MGQLHIRHRFLEPEQPSGGHRSEAASVVVIGLGSVGSHLITHLARNPLIRRIILIDPDRYDATSLRSQHIRAADVGMPKVWVQTRQLRAINPQLQVHPIRALVQRVPLGLLRAEAVCACLDSREARCYAAGAAWHLGVRYIDAGVEPSGLSVRVSAFAPGSAAGCYLCSYSDAASALPEQTHSCAAVTAAPSTNALSTLGALAATLQAIESEKVLAGHFEQSLIGRQLVIDARDFRHHVSAFRRNPLCRFDHAVWRVAPLAGSPRTLALQDLYDLTSATGHAATGITVRADGTQFVRVMTCRACGWRRRQLRLASRLRREHQRCPACGGKMIALGADVVDTLAAADVPNAMLRVPLSQLGFRNFDIVSVITPRMEHRFELGAAGVVGPAAPCRAHADRARRVAAKQLPPSPLLRGRGTGS